MSSITTRATSGFKSLNDDTLGLILKFVGRRSFVPFGFLNKQCHVIYHESKMAKETFVYAYAPLSVIIRKYRFDKWRCRKSVAKGVVSYNRMDVLYSALRKRDISLMTETCRLASEEGRFDILDVVFHNTNKSYHEFIFGGYSRFDEMAASNGQLEVLKWLHKNGFINYGGKYSTMAAANKGHLHVLEWMQHHGYTFNEDMCDIAAFSSQLHMLKW